MSLDLAALVPPPAVLAFSPREKCRELLKRAFPRRRGQLILVRTRADLRTVLQEQFVDAVIVDLAQPTDEHWAVAGIAREFPSLPFVGLTAHRPAESATIARALSEFEFADCLAEGVDDAMIRELLTAVTFSHRFRVAVDGAHTMIGLDTELQQQAWQVIIAFGGRPVRTEQIAEALQMTREHLSRRFSADGAPNLKRVIDVARLIAAAELAKNPGLDLVDVARILGYASGSHLSATTQRVIGVKSLSLARLRATDILERFAKTGRRSRT